MTQTRVATIPASAVLVLAVVSGTQSAPTSDPVTDWSTAVSGAAATSGMAPLRTPITLALLHVAMYDAVHAVVGGRAPYAVRPPVSHPASARAAAIEAGYRVAIAELPTQITTLDGVHRQLLQTVADGQDKTNGRLVGAEVAAQLLALRTNDGRNAVVTFTPRTGPGAWRPTPPGFLPFATAFLAKVTPFTLDSPSQFRPAGPPELGSKRWAGDYNEVYELGVKVGSARTPEQTQTALFWEPLAGTVWPASIRRLATEQQLDLPASAHFQAAAFAAFADGLIACWDAKLHYAFWRPVTAIRDGDADVNPQTGPDPIWEPFAVTPSFPEYPSGHACATAAVTYTIEDYFPQAVLIPARNIVTGEERFYRKASEAVDEVVEARMLIGVHFRSSNEDGADIGRRIARQIRSRWFKRDAS